MQEVFLSGVKPREEQQLFQYRYAVSAIVTSSACKDFFSHSVLIYSKYIVIFSSLSSRYKIPAAPRNLEITQEKGL